MSAEVSCNFDWLREFADYPCRMFENRVPHMLDNDYTPYSAIDIFVKDLVNAIFFFLIVN